jgi:hypothetical protein
MTEKLKKTNKTRKRRKTTKTEETPRNRIKNRSKTTIILAGPEIRVPFAESLIAPVVGGRCYPPTRSVQTDYRTPRYVGPAQVCFLFSFLIFSFHFFSVLNLNNLKIEQVLNWTIFKFEYFQF